MRFVCFALAFLTAPALAAELRVGAAAVVITPPEGTPLAGYYSERGSKTVLDDIYSKAIVLEVERARRIGADANRASNRHQVRPRGQPQLRPGREISDAAA